MSKDLKQSKDKLVHLLSKSNKHINKSFRKDMDKLSKDPLNLNRPD
jgi:hypothetical protein